LGLRSIQVLRDAERLGGAVDALVDFLPGHLAQLERELHVLAHRHVGVEGVALEDHRDVAILRGKEREHITPIVILLADRCGGENTSQEIRQRGSSAF